MYIVYKYTPGIKINQKQLILSLFEDDRKIEEREPRMFRDTSYQRTRTMHLSGSNARKFIEKTKTEAKSSYENKILNMELKMREFLKTNDPEKMYDTFQIPKKTGGTRTINAPQPELYAIQKELKNFFEYELGMLAHDSAYAYVKGRSIKAAIQRHQDNDSRWFLKLDIKGFFDNCNRDLIISNLLQIYPLSLFSENFLVPFLEPFLKIACLNNGLPQGTPLSPTLTNLIMINFDHALQNGLFQSYEHLGLEKQMYCYTRYADDLLISAPNKFERGTLIEVIDSILPNPLRIKDSKTRFGSIAGRNWNLGLMYNKDKQLTVGHSRKQRLKIMVFQFLKDYDIIETRWDESSTQSLLGQISFVRNIEPEYTQGLIDFYNKKLNKDLIKCISSILKQN